jgi:putative sigma-54 modulation protein
MDATVFFMIDNTSEIVLRHTAELTIHLKDREFFADAQNKDLYQAIDAVISKLECQVLKHKEQIQNYYEKHID